VSELRAGLFDTKTVQPADCWVSVSSEESVKALRDKFGHDLHVGVGDEGNVQVSNNADVILLCTKPQVAKSIFESAQVRQSMHEKLLISICAGTHSYLPVFV
jgi:pyrroline-5-carboxylate reductase